MYFLETQKNWANFAWYDTNLIGNCLCTLSHMIQSAGVFVDVRRFSREVWTKTLQLFG